MWKGPTSGLSVIRLIRVSPFVKGRWTGWKIAENVPTFSSIHCIIKCRIWQDPTGCQFECKHRPLSIIRETFIETGKIDFCHAGVGHGLKVLYSYISVDSWQSQLTVASVQIIDSLRCPVLKVMCFQLTVDSWQLALCVLCMLSKLSYVFSWQLAVDSRLYRNNWQS